jgi:hypothetical protein
MNVTIAYEHVDARSSDGMVQNYGMNDGLWRNMEFEREDKRGVSAAQSILSTY